MVRRVVAWLSATILVLSLAALGASLFNIGWRHPVGGDTCAVLQCGQVIVSGSPTYLAPGWTVYGYQNWNQRWWVHPDTGFVRRFPQINGATDWLVTLPLWMPASVSLAVVLLAWLPGRRARGMARRGVCAGCGYNLAGLAGGLCPECGRAAPTAATTTSSISEPAAAPTPR